MRAPSDPPSGQGDLAPASRSQLPGQLIASLVACQLGVHSSMAGVRMAAPLQALGEGASTAAVGLLLALFAAAPVALALTAGRMADRHGFHRPMRLAAALSISGALLAVVSTLFEGWSHIACLALGALLSGAGANFGVLAIQRTAGLAARDATERVRLFSWLGVAPSLANVVGPVTAGLMIDLGGFRLAYAVMLCLPLATLWAMPRIPRRAPHEAPAAVASLPLLSLLQAPGMKRLLAINWLLAICWDVHAFAVPVVGHTHGFSASVIGLILGTFTLSVTLIRLAIPLLAHRLTENAVVMACMGGTAGVFALYPLAQTPWAMAALAALLGVTLGSSQPMIMSTLHRLTPAGRHGESLAFRSMAINLSSVIMPLAFGALGAVVGAGALFWGVGALVGAGASLARRIPHGRH